jgi:hypothetical protein
MRNWAVVLVAGLALAGCARNAGEAPVPDKPAPIPIESDSIRYETGPCFGRCPVYSVTVRSDGSGVFEGKQHTEVTGTREFKLSADQYKAFADALAAWRPASGEKRIVPGEPGCEQVATDLPSVSIRWTRAIGDSQGLDFYYGCDMEKNEAMANALGNAPDALPLEELIGAQP